MKCDSFCIIYYVKTDNIAFEYISIFKLGIQHDVFTAFIQRVSAQPKKT